MTILFFKIKVHPHISNKMLLGLLNLLDLAVLKPHNDQPLVPYKWGPTVTSWTLQLTQTNHLQNNSKTPILRIITF